MDEPFPIAEEKVSIFGLLKDSSNLRSTLAILRIVCQRHLGWGLDECHKNQPLPEIYKGFHVGNDDREEAEFILS